MPMPEFDPTPIYPALKGLERSRAAARAGGIEERRAHGLRVLEAIGRLNRAAIMREVPSFRANCASGTFCNNAKDLQKAIRAQHTAALHAAVRSHQTRMVKEGYFEQQYELHMAEQRERRAKEAERKAAEIAQAEIEARKPRLVWSQSSPGLVAQTVPMAPAPTAIASPEAPDTQPRALPKPRARFQAQIDRASRGIVPKTPGLAPASAARLNRLLQSIRDAIRARDVEALRSTTFPTSSGSRKKLDRYRQLAIIAIEAQTGIRANG